MKPELIEVQDKKLKIYYVNRQKVWAVYLAKGKKFPDVTITSKDKEVLKEVVTKLLYEEVECECKPERPIIKKLLSLFKK